MAASGIKCDLKKATFFELKFDARRQAKMSIYNPSTAKMTPASAGAVEPVIIKLPVKFALQITETPTDGYDSDEDDNIELYTSRTSISWPSGYLTITEFPHGLGGGEWRTMIQGYTGETIHPMYVQDRTAALLREWAGNEKITNVTIRPVDNVKPALSFIANGFQVVTYSSIRHVGGSRIFTEKVFWPRSGFRIYIQWDCRENCTNEEGCECATAVKHLRVVGATEDKNGCLHEEEILGWVTEHIWMLCNKVQ